MKQRWTFRFYPTSKQKRILAQHFGCVRFVYNWALAERTKAFKDGKKMNYNQSSAALTKLKKNKEYSWLNDVSCVPTQQTLRHLQVAFVNFFEKRAGYPNFKKKSHRQSAEFTRSAFKFNQINHNVSVAKIGRLKIKWSRRLPNYPTTATLIRKPSGKYFVSFVVEVKTKPLPKTKARIGIDFGIARLATLSNGEHIHNPKHSAKNDARLRWAQKQLSRKQKNSKHFNKWRRYIASLHEKVSNSRLDSANKLALDIVRRFDEIFVEDLHIRGMLKNHKLARSLSDVAIALHLRKIEEKAAMYGKKVVKIDRFFPSSKMCSGCGCINESLNLATRTWRCDCGIEHDRDLNAALNILAVGQTVTAHGAGISTLKRSRLKVSRLRSANPSK